MSCLDTFCISHFEEREEYSRMTEKGLELDKADFAVNGYEVDEEKYPRHGPKDASSSGRGKMKMDDSMTVDLSEEESDDDDDDDDFLLPRIENTAAEPIPLESSEDEDEEAHSEGQSVPLIGSRLGAVSVGEEENEELARARGQATPRKLFVSSSQPSPSDPRRASRPSFSSPSLPLNPSNTRRSKRIAESEDRRRQSAMDDPDTPMLVASQASVSETPNPAADNVSMIMLSMLQKMQENQEASNKRNFDMLEQHRLDTEMRLEQQRKDMDIRMEQQRKDMVTMHDKTVQNVINQVPLIVHNAFLGMGGVMNVAPLQLKGPASSQPALMLTEGNPTPQGSGTSTRGESTGMGTDSLPHLSGQHNPDKECSLSPPNAAVASEATTMDVDVVARPTDAPAAG
jgi:hypothetical protein